MPICTFTNVLPKGWEQVPTRNSVLLLACLSGATLIMNLMTFAAIFYRIRGHHVKKTEIKMAVYSIFLFLSQQSYTCVFYTGYFGGSLPDLSINYFAKVIKPWAYVIFCLTPAVSLICLSKNVRSIVREAIRGQMIGSQNKVGSTMIRTVKETVLPVPKKLNRV
uniref:Serpentine receptor class gamma n=1 Tax=Rhabditophanes sp. KR3021 TaxID=114890 RepID=A0AC35TGX0_9BILA